MADGKYRTMTVEDAQAGCIIRMIQRKDGDPIPYFAPFSDTVILGVDKGMVTLARPYLFASSTETCCPGALMGYERYDVRLEDLPKHYVLVLLDSGKPYTMIT